MMAVPPSLTSTWVSTSLVVMVGVPWTSWVKSASSFSTWMSMRMVPSLVIWGVTSRDRLASAKATVMAPEALPDWMVG